MLVRRRNRCSPRCSHDYPINRHPVFGCATVGEEPNCRYQQPEAIALDRSSDFDCMAHIPRIRR
jgi:hypothetical protein